jgi:hypothetical protein
VNGVSPARALAVLGASLLVAAFNVRLALAQAIWSPRDEIAHYDYVDKLTSLHLPRPDEPISKYTVSLCRIFPWFSPPPFDGTQSSMGPAGFSYEARQPPLYYAFLAGPNFVMRAFHATPHFQIAALRYLTIVLFEAGALLLVLVFRELSLLAGVSRAWGWVLAVAVSLPSAPVFTTLGNDAAGLVCGSLAAFFGARFWRTRDPVFAVGLSAVAGLSVLVKHTNGLLVLLPLLAGAASSLWPSGELLHRGALRRLTLLLPGLIVAPYLLLNRFLFGSVMKSGAVTDSFASTVKTIRPDVLFVQVLARGSVELSHVGLFVPRGAAWVLLALLAGNLAVRSWRAFTRPSRWDLLVLLCCGLSVAVIVSAVLLNRLAPGVQWYHFRHYAAYLPFWFIAIFAFPLPRMGRAATLVRLHG